MIDEHPESSDATQAISREQQVTEAWNLYASGRHLVPGDVLSNRFVIIRFLASGGMGEVYEAADRHLQNKHLALKTLLPEIAGKASIRQRFEREVLVAREVNHPNVCPTFDIFRAEGPRGPVLFLTMKLLRGESLAGRLHRSGSLPVETAIPIARQMASGLDAAHRAGIIHRDFKPGNVMLENAGGEVRVAITDFGLSRWYESDETLAAPGQVAGTRGYLAPELFEGRMASPASDVYAFGMVLHEMLTGDKPRGQPGRPHDSVAPSTLTPGLPAKWDRVILGCLEKDPARRFQSAGEAMAALEERVVIPSRLPAVPRQLSRRHVLVAGAGAAACAAGGVWVGWPAIYRHAHPLPEKRFVALMAWPPEPASQQHAILKAVLDVIGNRLARAEAYVKDLLLISSSDLQGHAAPRQPSEAVSALGANLVLAASLRTHKDGYRLGLNILDAASAAPLRSSYVSASASDLGVLADKAAAAAARLLDIQVAPAHRKDEEDLASVPPAAYQLFTSAEASMSEPNHTGLDAAIGKYQSALEADPQFALGYAKLALAYAQKFRLTRERAALKLAASNADLALRYNPDSAKAVQSKALVYLYSGQTPEAVTMLKRALSLDPGNPEILVARALAFRDLDNYADEEKVYRELLKQRPNYWPAYNELGFVLSRQGRYREAAEAFDVASTVAPQVALPLNNLGAMYLVLNRQKEAADAFRRSLQHAPNALAYLNLGNIAFQDRDYRGALTYYIKARDLKPNDDLAWRNMADCYTMLGNPKLAAESYTKAAEIAAAEIATNPRRGAAWMTLAFYHAKIGRRADAEADLKAADARGATDLESQFTKAQTLAVLGHTEQALQTVLRCLDQGLSPVEAQLALDLKGLRGDPRYASHVATLGRKPARAGS
ncbi:MAG TPA: hypothetical protein DEQ47_20225 [Solibacterales bacterium]|nr:hypothetical protein [Bryobacterales bacterium]